MPMSPKEWEEFKELQEQVDEIANRQVRIIMLLKGLWIGAAIGIGLTLIVMGIITIKQFIDVAK